MTTGQAETLENSDMTGRDKVTKFIVFVFLFNLSLLFLLHNHHIKHQIFVTSPTTATSMTNASSDSEDSLSPTNMRFIYYLDYKQGDGMSKFAECQEKSQHCIITGDEHFIRHNGLGLFDAVIIHVEGYKEDQKAQMVATKFKKRGQKQVFIMKLNESPRGDMLVPFVNQKYLSDRFFNWTMSYRRDSDVYAPSGFRFLPKNSKTVPKHWRLRNLPTHDLSKYQNRSKMAFWMVSHCPTAIRREDYVTKLQEYIHVDIFGRCGQGECTRHGNDCFAELSNTHLFYLAFENSLCKEYVTEKFFRTLLFPVVPVVMGGHDNYKDFPPKSYIDVNDFDSIADLASYLIHLSENTEEYNQYFKWKEEYDIYTYNYWCQLCEKLHDESEEKIIESAYDWWYKDGDGSPTCSNGSERNYYQDL